MTETATKATDRALVIAETLDKSLIKIGEAIPKALALPSERVVRIAKTAVMGNARLRDCTAQSIVTACMKAAADGLVCDGREAALVPFNRKVGEEWTSEAQYIIMYRGMIKLAYRSQLVSTINIHTVYQAEFDAERFKYIRGDDERIEHDPIILGERGPAVIFYSIVRMRDGGVTRNVMSRGDILDTVGEVIRKRNPLWKNSDDNRHNFIEMCKKTVLRAHSKLLPFESDIAQAFDDHSLPYEEYEPDPDAAEGEPELQRPKRKAKGAAAEKLNNGKAKVIEGKAEIKERVNMATGEITTEEAGDDEGEPYSGDVV